MIRPATPKPVAPFYPSVVDIETLPDGTAFAIGLGYSHADELEYQRFDSWDAVIDFILTNHKRIPTLRKLYAHNGGGFDWLSLIEHLTARGMAESVSVVYNDSIVIGINVKVQKVRIQLRDSLRLLPASLEKLSKTFAVPVQKMKIECLPHELFVTDRERFEQYLKADVQALQMILYRFWTHLVSIAGNIGDLPMTLAALSLRMWTMGLEAPMMVPWGEKHKVFQRGAYFGGRTECFQSGSFDSVVVHDINSQYPYVMASQDFPISYRGMWTRTYQGRHGIYVGTYSQPESALPPLLRDAESGEFRYRGRGTYCMPELRKLLLLGGTFDCEDGFIFVDIGNPFKAFVNRWWGVRQDAISKGDDGLAFVCKILLNSLYGKFAQKESGFICKTADSEQRRTMLEGGVRFSDYGEYVVVEEKVEVNHGFVGLAAYITSYARLALYDAIERVYAMGGSVVYCDTDSVHAVGAELPSGTALGELKVEYRGAASYAGRKLYALHGEQETVKAKGIGRLERGPLDGGDIRRLAADRTASQVVPFGSFPTWREVLLGGRAACSIVRRERTLRNTGPPARESPHAGTDRAKMSVSRHRSIQSGSGP